MSFSRRSPSSDDDDEEEEVEHQPPAHHPCAPSDELFDISTTVDPSYVISLIRKLLPSNVNYGSDLHGTDACSGPTERSSTEGMDKSSTFSENGVLSCSNNEIEVMRAANKFGELNDLEERDDGINHQKQLVGEETWEEYGCILWDLAAIKISAELMVKNLILEVLTASLMVSQSARITEISLGILGNLACHEVSHGQIVSTNGLVEVIVDQLFSDNTPCLSETCRLLTSCIHGSEGVTWAEALRPQHVLSRILWIAENSLNPQLIEKTVGLLLAILESQQEVNSILVPPLMELGLPSLLINLLAFEVNKLTQEQSPERYPALDIILCAAEALSVNDNYSHKICLNKELFEQLFNLIKLPDKIEVANSCITAAVLIANILAESADLIVELSQDLDFLQGLLDVFPFVSDDVEAQSALWSTFAKLLVQTGEQQLNSLALHKYVSALLSKSDLIQEQLFDNQSDGATLHFRSIVLKHISSILSQWTASKDHIRENEFMDKHCVNKVDVDRLLDCCCRYIKSCEESSPME